MAILGIGQDLIEIDRISHSINEFGEQFLSKIFTNSEIAYCSSKASAHESYAARFAAKEAVAKAFATGIGEAISWHDIEVIRSEAGVPSIKLSAKFYKLQANLKKIHLSLSHTHKYATAIVILES